MAPLPIHSPAAKETWRMVDKRSANRVVIESSDTDGGCKAVGADGDVDQLDGTDYYEPPGIALGSLAGLEGAKIDDDSDTPIVLPRGTRPSGIPTPVAGSCLLYGPNGEYVYPNSSGDIEAEPKSGRTVKLGSGATKAVGLDGDTVNAGRSMAAWIAKVQAVVVAIDPTTVAPTDFGLLSASATKAKAE